jgi:hypothetical protein
MLHFLLEKIRNNILVVTKHIDWYAREHWCYITNLQVSRYNINLGKNELKMVFDNRVCIVIVQVVTVFFFFFGSFS